MKKQCRPGYLETGYGDLYSAGLEIEYRQLSDEGFAVEKYENLAREICKLSASPEREAMAEAAAELMFAAPARENYAFIEPSELDEIRAARKLCGAKKALQKSDKKTLRSKIKGAWLGRIAGCLLGKPFETIYTKELGLVLKSVGNYPLSRYILNSELTDEICKRVETVFPLRARFSQFAADVIDKAPPDDDTNYTVMSAVKIIGKYGRGFKPVDVLKAWTECMPKNACFTAERVAYLNYLNGYCPPDSAIYKNPYREWIGAQIRADYYGYINPADPEAAADMAFRDASVSHTKNGIYGAMFVAAMLAAAAVCGDMREIVLRGLAEIPSKSRLYAEVTELVKMYDAGNPAEDCVKLIRARYDEYSFHHWCHTISNALIVVTALLYSGKDFGKSISLAVSCGFDTDCNGATVGSIVGMTVGAENTSAVWTKPFNSLLDTSIFGVGTVTVEELVDLTMKHITF